MTLERERRIQTAVAVFLVEHGYNMTLTRSPRCRWRYMQALHCWRRFRTSELLCLSWVHCNSLGIPDGADPMGMGPDIGDESAEPLDGEGRSFDHAVIFQVK